MTDAKVNILGIAGSLREGSANRALLETAARDLMPEGMSMQIAPLGYVPLYNDDVRKESIPDAVAALGEKIAAADGVLIATPEYNYSVPGVLKNAIDWISRLPDQPFDGKPVAILGGSPGRIGTARAQYHLRQVFIFLNAIVMNRPEVMVGGVYDVFAEDGSIKDEGTADIIAAQMKAFGEWIGRHGKS